ncbi:MAG TPA: serine/threonine-protein kinase [Minicystis sp.]|nr:serine/threonine-protein kinase [Minicystis sp.]
MSAPRSPGDVVARRYRLEAHLGSGAAAEVWRAFDGTLRAEVALKILHEAYAGSEVARRFLREAQAAAQLRSLHVVQVLDQGMTESGTPFIAMELLEGETLAARLERDGRMMPADVCRVLSHVGKAAAKAHAMGIVHRDLKPHNVFLVRDDDEEITKVFDFGIAKLTRGTGMATSSTATGSLIGTPEYMSPEQASCGKVDFRTDLYAMGIVAFECLTGHVPFETEDVLEIIERVMHGELARPSAFAPVPPAFEAWFERATRLDPNARFGSAREMVAALERALLGPGA